ncbi:hypothetical protein [Pseudoalteromonas sp. T1lg23B]|uniref:hypothetical protein n=1 Tax=Pseudoalteromonas sp. T1lg23B TaxID=2077097 RepID=UPI001319DCB3|nr:hypothetical protein [Pseudoalteromonas sp. T1lg23B]
MGCCGACGGQDKPQTEEPSDVKAHTETRSESKKEVPVEQYVPPITGCSAEE